MFAVKHWWWNQIWASIVLKQPEIKKKIKPSDIGPLINIKFEVEQTLLRYSDNYCVHVHVLNSIYMYRYMWGKIHAAEKNSPLFRSCALT